MRVENVPTRRVPLADGTYADLPEAMVERLQKRSPPPPVTSDRRRAPPGPRGNTSSRRIGQVLEGLWVLLFGCGSIGGWIGWLLAQLGFNIHAIDNDLVEEANLGSRTPYSGACVNAPKPVALQYTIQQHKLGVQVVPYRRRSSDFADQDIVAMASQTHVVVPAIDDPDELFRLDRLLYGSGVPCVYAAFHNRGISGHVIHTTPQTACFACSMGIREPGQLRTLHAEPAHPASIRRIADMAALIVQGLCMPEGDEVRRMLPWDRNIIFLENSVSDSGSPERSWAVHAMAADRDPECPTCGGERR